MRKSLLIVCLSFFLPFSLLAQFASLSPTRLPGSLKPLPSPQLELYTNGFGAIVGVQQGRYTFIELGGEANWRKVKLSHPHTYGVGGTAEFNFSGVWGLKAYGWIKPARFDFTYGSNLVYYTNFEGSRFGISPNLGYKLLGFHFLAGVNLLAGNRDMTQYNTFYFTIRYYAPIQKKQDSGKVRIDELDSEVKGKICLFNLGSPTFIFEDWNVKMAGDIPAKESGNAYAQ